LMRILLSQRTNYLPARGGANRTNKLLVEELARRGHDCLVVAPALPEEYAADPATGVVPTRVEGVAAHLVTDRRRLIRQFAQDIDAFDPAVVIVSSEDFGQALLRTAIKVDRAPVVYFVQTVQALPFGPAAFFPSASATDRPPPSGRAPRRLGWTHALRPHDRAPAGAELRRDPRGDTDGRGGGA